MKFYIISAEERSTIANSALTRCHLLQSTLKVAFRLFEIAEVKLTTYPALKDLS